MAHFSSQEQPFVDGLVTLNVTVLAPILLHMPDVHLKYQFKKITKKSTILFRPSVTWKWGRWKNRKAINTTSDEYFT